MGSIEKLQSTSTIKKAVILLAHGSRDPHWRTPVQAVQAHMHAPHPQLPVCCAYLELCPPDLSTTIADLAATGVTHISITPLFLGTGRHIRADLPARVQALAQAHPHLHLHLHPPIGEDPRVLTLMADIASEAAQSMAR